MSTMQERRRAQRRSQLREPGSVGASAPTSSDFEFAADGDLVVVTDAHRLEVEEAMQVPYPSGEMMPPSPRIQSRVQQHINGAVSPQASARTMSLQQRLQQKAVELDRLREELDMAWRKSTADQEALADAKSQLKNALAEKKASEVEWQRVCEELEERLQVAEFEKLEAVALLEESAEETRAQLQEQLTAKTKEYVEKLEQSQAAQRQALERVEQKYLARIQELQSSHSRKSSAGADVEAKLSQLEEQMTKAFEGARLEKTLLEERLLVARTELTEARKEIESLKAPKTSHKAKIKALKAQLRAREIEHMEREAQLSKKLTAEMEEMEATLRESEQNMEDAVTNYTARLRTVEAEREELEQTLETLMQENTKLRERVSDVLAVDVDSESGSGTDANMDPSERALRRAKSTSAKLAKELKRERGKVAAAERTYQEQLNQNREQYQAQIQELQKELADARLLVSMQDDTDEEQVVPGAQGKMRVRLRQLESKTAKLEEELELKDSMIASFIENDTEPGSPGSPPGSVPGSVPPPPEDESVEIVRPYDGGERSDVLELLLDMGDRVSLIREEDGWYLGRRYDEGWFPASCLQPVQKGGSALDQIRADMLNPGKPLDRDRDRKAPSFSSFGQWYS